MRTDDLLNLERDIIQSRLVSAVFARSLKNQIVLKGGVAMRVLLGSARYTKDVDFGQNHGQSLPALQKLIRASIKECTSGFLDGAVVTEPKQTDTVARWKISGVSLRSRSIIHLTVEEAAGFIRAGAIVSLQTVLGAAGVLNNYTVKFVTAIIPSGDLAINTTGGIVESDAGCFSFKRLKPSMLYAGEIEDRLEPTPGGYLRATPEKALIDWISLYESGWSTLSRVPVMDMDLSLLDEKRLKRLAQAAGIKTDIDDLILKSSLRDEEEERQAKRFGLKF